MQEKGITQQIASYIAATSSANIAAEYFEHAKVALMDWVAVALAGMNEPLAQHLIRHAEMMGGHEQATVLGFGKRFNVAYCALVNGAMSHALDFDDTLNEFIGHPSVGLFPGILALAEWKNASGADFLASYLTGLQAGATVGLCGGFEHYAEGWHGTSTVGRIGSAAACAGLLGLNEEQITYALGIAGTQSSGLKRVFGTMCKPLNPGNAAQGGVTAALLAQDGFDSATDILEGNFGWMQAFSGDIEKAVVPEPGDVSIVQRIAQKYHASCHLTHSPVEAALAAGRQIDVDVENMKSVDVFVSPFAMQTAAIQDARSGLEGKFCIKYCAANALYRGDTGIAAFTDDKVNDPGLREWMNRVSVTVREDLEATPSKAEVVITSLDGNRAETVYDFNVEIPELETRREKIRAKFESICSPILGEERTGRLREAIESVDKAPSLKELIAMTIKNHSRSAI